MTKYAQDGWDPALAGGTGSSNWNVWADLTSSNSMQTRYLRGDEMAQIYRFRHESRWLESALR